jgi:hypothetical protein
MVVGEHPFSSWYWVPWQSHLFLVADFDWSLPDSEKVDATRMRGF